MDFGQQGGNRSKPVNKADTVRRKRHLQINVEIIQLEPKVPGSANLRLTIKERNVQKQRVRKVQ